MHLAYLITCIYSASFISFLTTWGHSKKVVQQAIPIIATLINDKSFIMIKQSLKCVVGKVVKCKYKQLIYVVL